MYLLTEFATSSCLLWTSIFPRSFGDQVICVSVDAADDLVFVPSPNAITYARRHHLLFLTHQPTNGIREGRPIIQALTGEEASSSSDTAEQYGTLEYSCTSLKGAVQDGRQSAMLL